MPPHSIVVIDSETFGAGGADGAPLLPAETSTDAGETLDEVVSVQVPNVGAPVIVTVLPVAKTLFL
ncbi:hypothetical protein AGMMS49950_11250 [Endomicrobiia bacterium]|nr:hypothetical protein AGMMS49950_11250 [Endomicrobiia bacterium]